MNFIQVDTSPPHCKKGKSLTFFLLCSRDITNLVYGGVEAAEFSHHALRHVGAGLAVVVVRLHAPAKLHRDL